MFGITKTKPAKKLTQAEAFEQFKAAVIAAVNEAKRHGVWDSTLGEFLSRYGDTLGGGR
jgi:hypothetical protein